MKTINEIKRTTNLYCDGGVIEDEGRQIFQSNEDGYIYVLNTDTKRASRYNAEGLNSKRIPVEEFESKLADMLLRIAKQEAEESANTEAGEEITAEILKAEEPKAKKGRKPRKSKDVAHEAEGVTLTAKQVDFIKHLPDTCFWENGLDSCIWVDCLCDDIQGQFANKPMTVGAMISTLCEKGLGSRGSERRDGRKCTSFELTAQGKAVAKSLGLH